MVMRWMRFSRYASVISSADSMRSPRLDAGQQPGFVALRS